MAVAYVGTHARILDSLAAHLAAGPSVRAFLGVGDDLVAARARIVEIDGEVLTSEHILLTAPRLKFSRTAGGAYRGPAQLGLILCAPAVAGDTAAEDQRRALNWLSPIMAWCTRLAWPLVRDIEDSEPIVLDMSDGLPGWLCAGIDLTVDVLP